MPSTKGGIGDLVRNLGLIAPLSKQSKDWNVQPAVKDLYVEGIDRLSVQYYVLPNDGIRASKDLKNAATTLLKSHGATIWGPGTRPWLFKPRDERANGLYPKHLYWASKEDRAFIKCTFRDLVIEKVIRYRKDHIKTRLPSVTSDPAWTSDDPSRSGASANIAPQHFKCFASYTMDNSHTNATYLKDQGIWLGDYDDEDKIVTSLSFNKVMENFYDATYGGLRRATSEGPDVNEWHSLEKVDKKMQCADCRAKGLPSTSDVVSRHVEFVHDHVTQPMHRTVWIYPCFLGNRKVFALLKCEKIRFDATYLWSFWKVDGSYTKDIFLTSARKQSADDTGTTLPSTNAETQPVFKAETESDQAAENPSNLPYGLQTRSWQSGVPQSPQEQVDYERGSYLQTPDQRGSFASDLEGWRRKHSHEVNSQNDGRRNKDEEGFDELASKLRLDELNDSRRKRQATEDSDDMPLRQRRRMMEPRSNSLGLEQTPGVTQPLRSLSNRNSHSFDEDYDLTPEVEDRRRAAISATDGRAGDVEAPTNISLFKRFSAPAVEVGGSRSPAATNATSVPGPTPSANCGLVNPTTPAVAMPAPAPGRVAANPGPTPPEEYKICFKVRDLDVRSIIKATKSTSVQEVSAAVEKRVAKWLDGKGVDELIFAFDDGSLYVGIDDSDTWEHVVDKFAELAADRGSKPFEGVIEVQG